MSAISHGPQCLPPPRKCVSRRTIQSDGNINGALYCETCSIKVMSREVSWTVGIRPNLYATLLLICSKTDLIHDTTSSGIGNGVFVLATKVSSMIERGPKPIMLSPTLYSFFVYSHFGTSQTIFLPNPPISLDNLQN